MYRRRSLTSVAIALLAVAGAFACSDTSSPDDNTTTAASQSGTDADSGSGGGGTTTPVQPASGPMASLRISPESLSLAVGYARGLSAQALNAKGQLMAPPVAAWSSSDPSIATVGDTGLVSAKAVGTTTVTASAAGFTASITVTVTATDGGGGAPGLVASFTLTGVVFGALPGVDTSQTLRVVGATATLYRVATADGTVLTPAVLVGTATTDANGQVVFGNLSSAYYRLSITAPAGSGYVDGSVSIWPPSTETVSAYLTLKSQ